MSLKREYDDEITLVQWFLPIKIKWHCFAIHFSKCFLRTWFASQLTTCQLISIKSILISRRETHSKVVDDFISFLWALIVFQIL